MVQHSYFFLRRSVKIYHTFEQRELMCICFLAKRTYTFTEGSPMQLDVITLMAGGVMVD